MTRIILAVTLLTPADVKFSNVFLMSEIGSQWDGVLILKEANR